MRLTDCGHEEAARRHGLARRRGQDVFKSHGHDIRWAAWHVPEAAHHHVCAAHCLLNVGGTEHVTDDAREVGVPRLGNLGLAAHESHDVMPGLERFGQEQRAGTARRAEESHTTHGAAPMARCARDPADGPSLDETLTRDRPDEFTPVQTAMRAAAGVMNKCCGLAR